jgi:Heterodisulfide reductase, subunit A and related polyferredoxins
VQVYPGILAAKNAAKNNLNTLLVEEKNALGGSTIYENNEFNKIDNSTPSEWLKKEIEELKNIKNLKIKTRTSVAAYHQYNYLLARENLTDHLETKDKTNKIRQRLLKIQS